MIPQGCWYFLIELRRKGKRVNDTGNSETKIFIPRPPESVGNVNIQMAADTRFHGLTVRNAAVETGRHIETK